MQRVLHGNDGGIRPGFHHAPDEGLRRVLGLVKAKHPLRVGHGVLILCGQPAQHGVVVVGAGVGHAVGRVVLRQVDVVIPAAKGEGQHLHAGIAHIVQQALHPGAEAAQILGNDGQAGKLPVEGAEQALAGAHHPFAAPGVGRAVGDGVVIGKADEVVDADEIIHGGHGAHAFHPPGVAVQAQTRPAVEGIAPQLTVGGKIVRRHTRYPLGHAVFVQLEHLRVRPGVGAVLGHIDGHVAKELDAQVVAVLFQREPLPPEQVLAEQVIPHLAVQFPAVAGHGILLTQADALVGPVGPHLVTEVFLHRGEQGEVLRPGILPGKVGQLLRQLLFRLRKAPAEQLFLVLPHGGEIHPVQRFGGKLLAVLVGEKALLPQAGAGDEHGVAREHTGGLVGRFAVAGGAHGQHLPQAHAACAEKIGKGKGFLAHAADASRPGQGGDMQQDSALTHQAYILSLKIMDWYRFRNLSKRKRA